MKRFLPLAIIVLVTAAAFSYCRHLGICYCDDGLYIKLSPHVYNGLSWDGLVFAFTDVEQSIWMPLTYLSYQLDYSLGWGYGGMHVQSVLWHCASALLLYLLLNRIFKNGLVSLVAALVWAVHPLRVESVAWLASRKDVISTFFLLAALLAWVRGGAKGLLLAFVLFVAGTMAKPSIMVLPAFAIAIDYLITGDRKHPYVYLTALGLALIVAIEAAWAQGHGATAMTEVVPLWYRVLNAFAALTIYLKNTVWPDALAMQCMMRFPRPPMISTTGLLLLAAILFFAFKTLKPRIIRFAQTRDYEVLLSGDRLANAVLCGIIIFFASLVPFLGIAGFGYHAFADRFTILPTMGVSLALAAILKHYDRALLNIAVPLIVIPVLGYKTYTQVQTWKDTSTIALNTLKVDGDNNVGAHRALGIYYWEYFHDMEKTYFHLKKAMDYSWYEGMKDYIGQSCHMLIEACYETGRDDEADEYYYWMNKWDYRRKGERAHRLEFLMADALHDAHAKSPETREMAYQTLARLKSAVPDDYTTDALEYRLAVMRGDTAKATEVLHRCANAPATELFNNRHWAQHLLSLQK